MNGAQDMGGMMGFGPVEEIDEPVRYHASWERRALGLTLAMGATGSWSIDDSRAARESLPPGEYLASSYYQIWIKGVEKLVLARNLVEPDELDAGKALVSPRPVKRVLRAEDVPAVLARGAPCDRPATAPAAFKVGDRVRMKNIHPAGHTRLPRYARGRAGTIAIVHGVHVFPDTNAAGDGEAPQWLYCVRFPARELWGEAASPRDTIAIDAWESYCERI